MSNKEIKFKVGDIVVNESGSYAKIINIKNGVYNGTAWTEEVAKCKEDEKGNTLFNDSAVKILGIKLAKKGGAKKEDAPIKDEDDKKSDDLKDEASDKKDDDTKKDDKSDEVDKKEDDKTSAFGKIFKK